VHRLLERQLRKHFGELTPGDPRLAGFIEAVGTAYAESDADRALLERSIELASGELLDRNARLELELAATRRLELELRQSEKLRAVGQLAAGVAHEINTPVQFVGDSVHFIREAFDDLLALCTAIGSEREGEPAEIIDRLRDRAEAVDLEFLSVELPKALDQTREGVRRVAAIVSALKDFGRPDVRDKTLADVNRCLESTLLVARNELKYVAEVKVELGELPLIPCYPGELNQVLLNLLVNAAHAVAERFGPVGERGLIEAVTLLEGAHVLIRVSDNGAGILPEHESRIFEPFFTTKPVGAGTGQGLAIARSIVVEKHGGSLAFESVRGEGTSFTVQLPVADDRPRASLTSLRSRALE
jgi:two-component system NtrC family sensor kinase